MSEQLTEARISRIRAGESEVVVYDSRAPGLFIRISPHGVRSWGFAGRLGDGTKFKMKLGRWPALSLAEARERARGLRVDADACRDPRSIRLETPVLSVGELVAAFIAGWCRPRNRHWLQQQRALERVVCDEWGWRDRPVGGISRREISEQLRRMISADGKRAIRANRVHAVLHKMLRWAAGQGYIEATPMLGMGKPSPERSRDRTLTNREVHALWKACHGWQRGDQLHPMAGAVLMALLTGQRMGECVGLCLEEIGADGIWRLPAARVKNKTPHRVPLSRSALGLVQKFSTNAPFPFGGKPVGSQEKAKLDRLMRGELCDAYRPWRLHDLRRTVRSGLAAAGVSWEMQHRVQNHLSPLGAMDRVYQRHDYTADLKAALEAWETRLLSIIMQPDAG